MRPRLAYQGVPGSFSEQALRQYFPNDAHVQSVTDFEDIFVLVSQDKIDFGVLPIENSSTGGIFEVFDYLKQYQCHIVGETYVQVAHHLMGCPGATLESIQEVYSHPQGFRQSGSFLKNYPQWALIPYYNTAISAKYVMEQRSPHKAAIASYRAAELYNLEIIAPNIQDVDHNFTRFIIVGQDLSSAPEHDKVSVVFAVPDSVGSLYNVLGIFAHHQINLLSLHSRPNKHEPWASYFYLDFAGNLQSDPVQKALKQLRAASNYFQVLGSYCACTNNGSQAKISQY